MNQRNYQKELETVIEKNQQAGRVPSLFLHSCCAPCSSHVLEYLSEYFSITVFYYNPNISFSDEYEKRIREQRRLVEQLPARHPITFEAGPYEPERFFAMAKGMEQEPEGGARCAGCYRLRLEETARRAAAGGYDYFATTLTISPLKSAEKLNEIGEQLAGIWNVSHLPSNFKKKNGYRRSVELSEIYGLYRQDYCGCVFSKEEQRRRKQQEEKSDKGRFNNHFA